MTDGRVLCTAGRPWRRIARRTYSRFTQLALGKPAGVRKPSSYNNRQEVEVS